MENKKELMKSKTNNKEGERGRRKEQNIQTSQKTKKELIETVFRLDKMKFQIYLCTFLIYNIKISSFKMRISPRKRKEIKYVWR